MSIYRPRKIGLRNILLVFIPLLILIAISFAFEAVSLLSFLEGFSILAIFFGMFFFLGFRYTYITISGDKIKFVKFLFFRQTVDIERISKLTYRDFGTRGLNGVTVHYTSKHGLPMSAVLGSIGAYGQEQISSILREIVNSNSEIKTDAKVQSLVNQERDTRE